MTDDPSAAADAKIPTNLRLLYVLEEVSRRGEAIKPMDLVEKMDLPKATIHRLLRTAEAEGFLQRDVDGRSYGPGRRLRRMALNTLSSEHLRTARLAIMQQVADEIGETCNLATPDARGMIYLERVETKWPLRIQLPIGSQVPFHATASGKMYLSTLKPAALRAVVEAAPLQQHTKKTLTTFAAINAEVQMTAARGYAIDQEEFLTGMTAVAVPISAFNGHLMATISIHAPVQRSTLDDLLGHLALLRQAARELARINDQTE